MIYERRVNIVFGRKEKEFIEDVAYKFIPFLEKHGATFVGGIYQPISGAITDEFYYIMGYDSLAHREKVYEDLNNDPEYQKLHDWWWAQEEEIIEHYYVEFLKVHEYPPPSKHENTR